MQIIIVIPDYVDADELDETVGAVLAQLEDLESYTMTQIDSGGDEHVISRVISNEHTTRETVKVGTRIRNAASGIVATVIYIVGDHIDYSWTPERGSDLLGNITFSCLQEKLDSGELEVV